MVIDSPFLSVMSSLSDLLRVAARETSPHILPECSLHIQQIAREHPAISELLLSQAQSRASYLMPQLFLELGYSAVVGSNMDAAQRSATAPFAMLCLSCGIADDLIDSANGGFTDRMGLGCMALAIAAAAWSIVAQDSDCTRRTLLGEVLSAFVADGINTAYREMQYAKTISFSLDAYLEVSSHKAAVYTEHSLLIAHAISGAAAPLRHTLSDLGRSTGLALQMLDDLLDVDADGREAPDAPLTYALFLRSTGQPLSAAYDLIDETIERSKRIADSLPHPTRLIGLLDNLQSFLHYYGTFA